MILFAMKKNTQRYVHLFKIFQLAAWELGVGMLWTITPYMHDANFYDEIGLDIEKDKIAAVMQIGYPKKVPKSKGEHRLIIKWK